MKPDSSETVYDGKLFDVSLERWGDHEREIVEHPGAVAILAVVALAAFGLGLGTGNVVLLFLGMYNAGHLALRAWGLQVGLARGR